MTLLVVTPGGSVQEFATADEIPADLGVYGLLNPDGTVTTVDGIIFPTIEAYQLYWGRYLIDVDGWPPELAALAVGLSVLRLHHNQKDQI